MNSREFCAEIKQLAEQIEGFDNQDVIFMALSNLNKNFIHSIASGGAGPLPAPTRNPRPVHGQTIACTYCGHTMSVK